MSRAKRVIGNLALLLLSLGFVVVLAETVLQFVYSPPYLRRPVTEFDPVLGWRLKPGTYPVSRKETENFRGFDINVNALGMRNPDVAMKPAADVDRVLVMGDSFTFGMLVAQENLLSSRTQHYLQERGEPVEVVNSGVQGWGTAHQYLYAKGLLDHGFETDIVLLMFFPNDLLDNLALDYDRLQPIPHAPRFAVNSDGGVYLQSPPKRPGSSSSSAEPGIGSSVGSGPSVGSGSNPGYRRSFGSAGVRVLRAGFRPLLPTFIKTRAIGFLETKPELVRLAQRMGLPVELPRLPSLIRGWYGKETLDPGWALTAGLLKELRDEVHDAGSQLAIAVIPSPFQMYEAYDHLIQANYGDDPLTTEYLKDRFRPQRMVGDLCRQESIPFLDLSDGFGEAADGPNLYSSADHHLSGAGHDVTGRLLAEFLAPLLNDGSKNASH